MAARTPRTLTGGPFAAQLLLEGAAGPALSRARGPGGLDARAAGRGAQNASHRQLEEESEAWRRHVLLLKGAQTRGTADHRAAKTGGGRGQGKAGSWGTDQVRRSALGDSKNPPFCLNAH